MNDDPGSWATSPPRITNPLGALLEIHHLAPRFIGSLRATPPPAADEAWADRYLTAGERTLWIDMSNQDRRHSIAVARRFAERRSDATREEMAGALLHDVGKIECELGPFGRVAATLIGRRTERFRAYHDHEEIGARLAESVGSDPVTVQLISGTGPAFGDLNDSDHA